MTTLPKLLLVDDEPFNIDYLEQELEDKPYELLTAHNGQHALEMIAAHEPDMVLLDIMMPIMDGFSVLQKIKANPKWNDMAVVIISANNDMTSVVKGIEMGADDFLPKPFNPVLLHARISSGLEKKRLRDLQRKLFHTFSASEVADEVMAKVLSWRQARRSLHIIFRHSWFHHPRRIAGHRRDYTIAQSLLHVSFKL